MTTKTKSILLTTLDLSFAIANTVSASFSQNFKVNNNGWNVFSGNVPNSLWATRVPSGTHGVTSHTGSFHAEASGPAQLCDGTVSAATNWGGYSRPFPVAGYTTHIWVFLNMAAAPQVNDTRFDLIASSVNDPDILLAILDSTSGGITTKTIPEVVLAS